MNKPAKLGFIHHSGRYLHGVSPFPSQGSWSCTFTEGYLVRDWEHIVPGCRCSMSLSHSLISPRGWGVQTMPGSVDPRDRLFYPRFGRSCRDTKIFLMWGGGPILPRCGRHFRSTFSTKSARKSQWSLARIWPASQLPEWQLNVVPGE